MANTGTISATRRLVTAQSVLGFCANLFFALPYCRRVTGLHHLDPARRCIFVANHVSLLDTILLGALFWRAGAYPVLVLGDRKVWHATAIRRALSRNIGFLLERGKMNAARLDELREFASAARDFQLLVFPEGTRGDGTEVAECQPGIFHIAQHDRVPIVPVFIAGMQHVSTKTGRLHLLSGLRKVSVHFGPALEPADYLALPRDEFTALIRRKISDQRPAPAHAHDARPHIQPLEKFAP